MKFNIKKAAILMLSLALALGLSLSLCACGKDEVCAEHTDADGNGLCDICSQEILAIEPEGGEPDAGGDENGGGNSDGGSDVGDDDGFLQPTPELVTLSKDTAVAPGKTLYPAYTLDYSGKVYSGESVEYIITVKNGCAEDQTVFVLDTVPEGCEFLSGCDNVSGNKLKWELEVKAGEAVDIKYTVRVSAEESKLIESGVARMGNKAAECRDLFVERTLNPIDQKYIANAIKALMPSTFEGMSLASRIYIHAFSQGITSFIPGSAYDTVTRIFSGIADESLLNLVAPSLYGGKTVSAAIPGIKGEPGIYFGSESLVTGDLLITLTDYNEELYIYSEGKLYNITGRFADADFGAVISGLADVDKYVVIRPSIGLPYFTPSDPCEAPEELTEAQQALVSVAESYLLRGERMQYDDTSFGSGGEYRWQNGVKSPEDYTQNEWGYTNCAAFTYDVYWNALGYNLPGSMYTTKNLVNNSPSYGMRAYYFVNSKIIERTEEDKLAIKKEIMEMLIPGDLMVVRRLNDKGEENNGHVMLYVGNGKFIHSSGSSFKYVNSNGVGEEVYEASVRCQRVNDYLFNEKSTNGYIFGEKVNKFAIVRPLDVWNGEIPEETLARMQGLGGIVAEKLSTHASSQTVNNGDNITFTFSLYNTNDKTVTLSVSDVIPENTVYVSGGDTVLGNNLSWSVTLAPGETKLLSYTVRVADDAPSGAKILARDGKVAGVSVRCPEITVKRTLTASEQEALLEAISQISAEGTSLKGIALINEIYKRAFGIESVFADTDYGYITTDPENGLFTLISDPSYKLHEGEGGYRDMLVSHLYGGYKFKTENSNLKGDRTRIITEKNLVIGDVIIARTSKQYFVFMYAGGEKFLNLTYGIELDSMKIQTRCERFMGFNYYFAALRPSGSDAFTK